MAVLRLSEQKKTNVNINCLCIYCSLFTSLLDIFQLYALQLLLVFSNAHAMRNSYIYIYFTIDCSFFLFINISFQNLKEINKERACVWPSSIQINRNVFFLHFCNDSTKYLRHLIFKKIHTRETNVYFSTKKKIFLLFVCTVARAHINNIYKLIACAAAVAVRIGSFSNLFSLGTRAKTLFASSFSLNIPYSLADDKFKQIEQSIQKHLFHYHEYLHF